MIRSNLWSTSCAIQASSCSKRISLTIEVISNGGISFFSVDECDFLFLLEDEPESIIDEIEKHKRVNTKIRDEEKIENTQVKGKENI